MQPRFGLLALTLAFGSISDGAFAAQSAVPAAGTPPSVSSSPSDSSTGSGEDFEESMIQRALSQHSLRREISPAGKKIERIIINAHEVIEEDDPWPDWANGLHSTTKHYVIARELLFKKGDEWDSTTIAESERNLRGYLYVSTARIVAAQGSRPDSVTAVVVTKDVWSLRPNMAFSFVGSRLELLEFMPAEHNLAGRNKLLGGDIRMDLATYLLGVRYSDPRLLGSRLYLDHFTDVIWNRQTGQIEGGVGQLAVGEPLFQLSSDWAWSASLDFRRDIYRLFSDGEVSGVRISSTGETLPYSFRRHVVSPRLSFTRRFGSQTKHEMTIGWRGLIKRYEIPDPGYSPQPATLAAFSNNVLPFSEEAGIVSMAYEVFRPDFVRLVSIDTFALSEDYRLGPQLELEIGMANRMFGFSSDFGFSRAGAGWLWQIGDDFFSLGASASTRYQQGVSSESNWVNQKYSLRIKNISPRFSGWRLHTEARLVRRLHDLDHSIDTLGGDTSLRGFPSGYLAGPNSWGANAELRSSPYVFKTIHLGLAGFADAGDAFYSPDASVRHLSVGAGVRIGFPQANRPVLRLDVAYPLEDLGSYTPAYFTAQFGQAF